MRIGIVSDFHVGGTRDGVWNNLQLQRYATAIARTAIETLNAQAPDLVVVNGDLTEDGYREGDWTHQLALARTLLLELRMPWYVVPGNHDRTLLRTGEFDRMMGDHVLPPYTRRGDLGIVGLREGLGAVGNTYSIIGKAQIEQVVAAVANDPPQTLLVFSHFPLVSEASLAEQYGGKYTGHFEDGVQLLERLAPLVSGRIVVFSAHTHWHHVVEDPRWVQITTGAMVEYPIELRMVTLDSARVKFELLGIGTPQQLVESLSGAEWVRGREPDRQGELALVPRV